MQTGGGAVGLSLPIPLPSQSFVVVVDSHGQHFLGFLLAHDLFVEEGFDLLWLGDGGEGGSGLGSLFLGCFPAGFPGWTIAMALAINQFLVQDLVAEIDAFIADVNARACDELSHLILRLAAEGALEMGVELCHELGRGGAYGAAPLSRCLQAQAGLRSLRIKQGLGMEHHPRPDQSSHIQPPREAKGNSLDRYLQRSCPAAGRCAQPTSC